MSQATECRKYARIANVFWQQVEKTETCWLWRGNVSQAGYGYTELNDHRILAHRLAYLLKHGTIAPKLFICHHCDIPPCVRPAHLFCGTPLDNTRDMIRKYGCKKTLKLNYDQVCIIRDTLQQGDYKAYRLTANAYHVTFKTVYQIVHKLTYKELVT